MRHNFTQQLSLIAAALLILTSPVMAKDCQHLGLSQCPTPHDENIPDPANMLSWSQTERAVGLRNTYKMYEGDAFKPGDTVLPLPKANYEIPDIRYIAQGVSSTLQDYLTNQSVTGLLILKDGEIVFEYYDQGNTPNTLWTSRSVAKSIVTVLLGIALQDGQIESVDDPLVKYLPELKDSAWENVTVEQLMQHTSGIAWNEDYADPNSDFANMTTCEAGARPFDCVFELVKSRPKIAEPGEIWSYSTGGAWLVGVLLERVTGKTIANYLEQHVWQPYGMEQEGVWQALEKNKVSMGGHGFHANLRDWGRFGLFIQNNGVLPNGKQVLPIDWIRKSTKWTQAKNSPTSTMPNGQYGYQWWFKATSDDEKFSPSKIDSSDHTFWALGIYGQSIGINQKDKMVIVQWSAQEAAYPPQYLQDEQVVFFNAVTDALKNH